MSDLLFQLLDEIDQVSISAEGELVQISVGERKRRLSLAQMATLVELSDQLLVAHNDARVARSSRLRDQRIQLQGERLEAALDDLAATSTWGVRDVQSGVNFPRRRMVQGGLVSSYFYVRGLFWSHGALSAAVVDHGEPHEVIVGLAKPWWVLEACVKLGIPLYQEARVVHLAKPGEITHYTLCAHCRTSLDMKLLTPIFPTDKPRCTAWRRAEPDWTAPAFPPPAPSPPSEVLELPPGPPSSATP
jgi:hypothetical protein